MRNLFKEHGAEALIGLLVILLALWFGAFAWGRTGGGRASGAIHVVALFPNATGINVGTVVRVAGLKVGQVSDQKLDPKSFQADVTLALDPSVKIPSDSSAAITSEGILGGTYIALVPGGDSNPLKDGDTIIDTQGSVDLMSMVGQFINKSGGTPPKSDAPAADAAPAAGNTMATGNP